MTITAEILRRRKLGFGSCKGIAEVATEPIEVVRNDRKDASANIVFRWGCTSTIMKNDPQFIFNIAKAIHNVTDKPSFRKSAIDAGVQCPQTFFTKEDAYKFMLESPEPVELIGRRSFHSQGRHAEHIVDIGQMDATQSDYWSVIIPKTHEYRVYCFMGRVIAVAEKIPTNPKALLWNNAQGGSKFVNVRWNDWPLEMIRQALMVHKLSGLDYEGVDMMMWNEEPYFLESNSAPSLTSPYRKQCFAKAFSWAIKQIKETGSKPKREELPQAINTWKDVAHQAIK